MPEARSRSDRCSAVNVLVEIDGVTVAGFSECSGLTNETDLIEYRKGVEATTVCKLLREGSPAKWVGPTFNAKTNEAAIEKVEICHEDRSSSDHTGPARHRAGLTGWRRRGDSLSLLDVGVHVEFPLAQEGIVARRTDIAGFVGIAERGPIECPARVESSAGLLGAWWSDPGRLSRLMP
jgi:hypothetical protein